MDKKEHRKTIPCDDQPATQTGELAKRLRKRAGTERTLFPNDWRGNEGAEIYEQAAAYIEALEKACGLAYEGLCTNDLDACERAIKFIDQIMFDKKAALGEETK